MSESPSGVVAFVFLFLRVFAVFFPCVLPVSFPDLFSIFGMRIAVWIPCPFHIHAGRTIYGVLGVKVRCNRDNGIQDGFCVFYRGSSCAFVMLHRSSCNARNRIAVAVV